MIGVLYDRTFEAFEANLDWLETTGILVERFDPSAAPSEMTTRPVVQKLLSAEGDACLPLILVNDAVVSRGAHLSRTQMARAVGSARGAVPQAVARQLAAVGAVAAVGSDEDIQRETVRARQLGIGEDTVRLAKESGARLRHADVHAARPCDHQVGILRDGPAG
jgi:hypothetical protein